MRCIRRRRSATLQEITTTQNTNRSKRTINVISECECGRRLTPPFYPLDGVEASVCRGQRGVKQKAVLSRACATRGSPEANLGPPRKSCNSLQQQELRIRSSNHLGKTLLFSYPLEFAQCPCTGEALPGSLWNRRLAGNSPPRQPTCAPRQVLIH